MNLLTKVFLDDEITLTSIRESNVENCFGVALCGFHRLNDKFLQVQRKETNIAYNPNGNSIFIQLVSVGKIQLLKMTV